MASSIPPGLRPCDRSALQQLTGCLLWPRLTSRSADVTTWPFQAQGEISPDKNTVFHRTTAGFTPLHLGHGSFVILGPLAPVRSASYPILVHQPTASFHASFRRSVTLPPLRFPSLAVTCSGEDSHLQDRAHDGRTSNRGHKFRRPRTFGSTPRAWIGKYGTRVPVEPPHLPRS